ncbi:class I SAM-dependent methyltransferase [Collimonas sp. PA-H2]|uniref:class I SAM-dependent methyltransferase n=1 Tax=Collimonas sp. PA-H2 TaxID=1881062 RepID=UPI001181307F|nr:class I SAM-dependent methyltransferase [Collimonas sp. PA-H2]
MKTGEPKIPTENNELAEYFHGNQGRYMRKWQHYFEAYEWHFQRFKGKPLHLLEIGCYHGGSLQMWRHYFGSQIHVHGVDIDVRCKQLEEAGVSIYIGDQGDDNFLSQLVSQLPPLDIIIDDGGHFMHQQIKSFDVLFPHLKDGGVYVCEDLHTSYWASHGGGYRKRDTFIEMSKDLIDQLNAWHSKDAESFAVNEQTRHMHSLHFYDSMLVIEKRERTRPTEHESGKRVFDSDPTGEPYTKRV